MGLWSNTAMFISWRTPIWRRLNKVHTNAAINAEMSSFMTDSKLTCHANGMIKEMIVRYDTCGTDDAAVMLDVIVEVFDKQATVAASPLRTCSASHHSMSSRTRTQHRHPDLMLLHTLSVDMIYIKQMT